jgi:hypothetical protein
MDDFTRAYIEAIYFTEDEEIGDAQLSDDAREMIAAECAEFQADPAWLDAYLADAGTAEQAGHDFWLTRNGHGAGFWDGDWPEPHATALDCLSKRMGEIGAYLGDDGLVYLM